MSIVQKTNRDGIDVVIDSLQSKFYPNLLGFWNIDAVYTCYPRANKNYREDQIIPEISVSSKEYEAVLYDDKVSVNSFFLKDDDRVFQDENKQIKQTISIIFQADLVKLYSDTERVDEVFNMDVLRVIKKENFYIRGDIEITEGVDNVYQDLTLTGELKDQIKYSDLSNRHVVKFTFDVLYKYSCAPTITPVCTPVSVRFNGIQMGSVASGGTYEGNIINQNDTQVGEKDGDNWVVNTEGDPATYQNSDGSFIQSIDSGDTYVAPDIVNQVNGVNQDAIPANTSTNYVIPLDTDLFLYLKYSQDDTNIDVTIDSNSAGTITSVDSTGLTSVVIEVNGSPETVPFDLDDTDTLEITFDSAAADGTITLTGNY